MWLYLILFIFFIYFIFSCNLVPHHYYVYIENQNHTSWFHMIRLAWPMKSNEVWFPCQFLDKMKAEEKTWTKGKKTKVLQTWKKKIDTQDGPVMYGVAEVIIPWPPEVVLYNIQCLHQRKKWEDNYTEDDILEGDCYTGIERVVCKSPLIGFSKREMILHR